MAQRPLRLGSNRASILRHNLSVGCRWIGKVLFVIRLGRNYALVATRHQPIQVGAHVTITIAPGQVRGTVCRYIDKMYMGDIVAEHIKIAVNGIPRHRHGAHIKKALSAG